MGNKKSLQVRFSVDRKYKKLKAQLPKEYSWRKLAIERLEQLTGEIVDPRD